MQIIIADRENSKVGLEANVDLLWTSVLFAENIMASSFPSNGIYVHYHFDSFPEKMRFETFMDWIKRGEIYEEKDGEGIERVYKLWHKVRNMKNKTTQDIIFMKQTEGFFKKAFTSYKDATFGFCRNINIKELVPLSDKEGKKPLVVIDLGENDSERKVELTRFNFIALAICSNSSVSFFDSLIKNSFKSIELNKINEADPTIDFISEELFEFPSPLTLTTEQVHVIRNQMSSTHWKYLNALEKLNEELAEINFAKENFNIIAEKYNTHTSAFKSLLQKTIDDTEVLSELKKENTFKQMHKLHIGIASYGTVLKMYKTLEMILEETELYAREQIIEEVNINNSTVFLFLETVKPE